MSVSLPAASPAADTAGTDTVHALPVGHRLQEFEVRSVIGVGGFGIVYRAFDHSLEREVAIKEYLPAALAGRSGAHQVSLLSASHSETFALGLSSFVNEAKLLARFDHPSLLKVHRFWEDNGTAYMVMPLYRGRTLRQWRQRSERCPDGAWLLQLTEHLLGALEVLHAEGVYHRDIAPDNVIVADEAPPVLLDFGAARRVISGRSQSLTAILKPHYAPLEQYAEASGMSQGPWTDFYALGATLHFLLTGRPPQAATARALSDDQPRLAGAAFGNVPDRLLQVCDWMLALRPHERPQHVAELRNALAGEVPVPQRVRPADLQAWQSTVVQQPVPRTVAAPRRGERIEPGIWEDGAVARAAGPSVTSVSALNREAPVSAAEFDTDQRQSAAVPADSAVERGRSRRAGRAWPLWGMACAMVVAAFGGWWASSRPAPVEAGSPAVAAAAVDAAAAASPAPMVRAAPEAGAASVRTGAAVPAAQQAAPRADGARGRGVRPEASRRDAARNPESSRDPGSDSPRAAAPSAAVPQADAVRTPVAADPVVATPGPAIVPPPVTVAAAKRNPREMCGSRRLVALHRCLVRECEKPEFQSHRECVRTRDIETRSRGVLGS